eukprot:745956-Hanusia_phi.AAC.1
MGRRREQGRDRRRGRRTNRRRRRQRQRQRRSKDLAERRVRRVERRIVPSMRPAAVVAARAQHVDNIADALDDLEGHDRPAHDVPGEAEGHERVRHVREEAKLLSLDQHVIQPLLPEEVSNQVRNARRHHNRQQAVHVACALDHDDDKRDRSSLHPPQHRRGPGKRVDPRKHPRVHVELYILPHHAAQTGADEHAGHEDARRDVGSKRDQHQHKRDGSRFQHACNAVGRKGPRLRHHARDRQLVMAEEQRRQLIVLSYIASHLHPAVDRRDLQRDALSSELLTVRVSAAPPCRRPSLAHPGRRVRAGGGGTLAGVQIQWPATPVAPAAPVPARPQPVVPADGVEDDEVEDGGRSDQGDGKHLERA